MSQDELIRVYTTYDPAEADVLRLALEEEGVACRLENEHQAGLSGVLQIGLLVRGQDAIRARAIIDGRRYRADSPSE